jgi:hypothetical protein
MITGLRKMIKVKKIEKTPYDNLQFAIEVAWGSLVDRAIKNGLLPKEKKPAGLMYMPTQEVTQQFKSACEAVLKDIGVEITRPNELKNNET